MHEFYIEITKTLKKKIRIEAEDKNDAERKAWLNYYDEKDKEYELNENNSLVNVGIEVITEQKELFK